MKKILAILLSSLLMLSVVACGNKPATDVEENENLSNETIVSEEIETENEVIEEEKTPESKPEEKPQTKPEEKPEAKPEQKPDETPEISNTTLGKTLLSDFKTKAKNGMSAQAIADALMQNPAITFGGMAVPVEEGLLMGFDNAEIKGFKNGYMFAPMIGSIPFVGYVFELQNETDVKAFISNLEKNANRRWNICVEADETVTGNYGNKVFFVMCPTSLEE